MIWRGFFNRAASAPAQEALVFGDVRLTYGALATAAEELGRSLPGGDQAGPRRVLLRHRKPAVLLQRVLACWSRGFVPVVLREGTTEAQILEFRDRLAPAAILIDDEALGGVEHRSTGKFSASTHGAAEFQPRDEALILATSGSTGAPKFVALPAESVCLTASTIIGQLGFCSDDRIAVTTPLGYAYGLMGASVPGLLAGATLILAPPGEPPIRTHALIRGERITVVQGPPSMFRLLLAYWRSEPFDSVRLVTTGGESLPRGLTDALHRAFPSARKVFLYGMTEAGPRVAHEAFENGGGCEGCVGRPFAHFDWRLEGVPGAAAGEGRLLLRGPSLFLGYVAANGSYEGLDAEGFFATNDLLATLPDGRLAFRGRLDRVFKSGGRLVNPAAVEALLRRHPDVADAACFPEEHEWLGLVPVAEILLRPGASLDEGVLLDFCRLHAEPHCVPRRIAQVAEWTLNDSGKRRTRAVLPPGSGQ